MGGDYFPITWVMGERKKRGGRERGRKGEGEGGARSMVWKTGTAVVNKKKITHPHTAFRCSFASTMPAEASSSPRWRGAIDVAGDAGEGSRRRRRRAGRAAPRASG